MPDGLEAVNRVPCKSADRLGEDNVNQPRITISQKPLELVSPTYSHSGFPWIKPLKWLTWAEREWSNKSVSIETRAYAATRFLGARRGRGAHEILLIVGI